MPMLQLTGCTGDANCTVTPGEHIAVTITRVADLDDR